MRNIELAGVDLYDFDLFQTGEINDVFQMMRSRSPIFWHDNGQEPFWSVTKCEDIRAISRDTTTFTSTRGVQLGDSMGRPPSNVLTTDPPEHTRLRRVTAGRFRPSLVRILQSAVDATCSEIVDGLLSRGHSDFVADVAAILPMNTICSLFGVPRSDWDRLFEMQNRMVGSNDPDFSPTLLEDGDNAHKIGVERSAQARLEIGFYFYELAERKKQAGLQDDDLITVLIKAGLETEIFLTYCVILVVAGNETTRQSLAGGTAALMEFPDQYRKLAAERHLLDTAVEEMIRWVTPVIHFMRVATRDVEIRGEKIREGDKVALWYLSGNRDEDTFVSPFTLDIGRNPNEHVGFGFGEHFCLGAHLARLQMRTFFTHLLDKVADLQFRQPPERMRSNFINGFKRMEVVVSPR